MTSKAPRSFAIGRYFVGLYRFCCVFRGVFGTFCEMASVSTDNLSDHCSESSEEQSSKASEGSFHSTNEDFLPYDESLEPIANEQEAAAYVEQVAQEEEEEEILWGRFSGEEEVENWFVLRYFIFVSFMDGNLTHWPFIYAKYVLLYKLYPCNCFCADLKSFLTAGL